MSLSKIKDIKNLDLEIIESEIINIKKSLFDLRVKKGTGQKLNPHLFKHYRHKLNQLILIKYQKFNKD
jgi:large subunit ribosomal protein L29